MGRVEWWRGGVRELTACAALALCLAGTGPGPNATAEPPPGDPDRPGAVSFPGGPVGGTAVGQRGAWAWPLGGPSSVLRPFDPPAQRWLSGHRGVDLAASVGDVVRSPAAGKVAFAGTVVDRPVVTVDHGGGLVSSFEPAISELPVGATAARGGRVAIVGTGGHCSGACLHWGLRLDGEYIDPLNTISDRRPSVLLPLP